jgi:phenylacetyl-CoA:acceptor oxidoreductase subunit 1
MTRWAMVADLERCVGCQTCTAACRHANATSPAVQWRKVLDIESGAFPSVSRTFVPVGCQHCADPPCMHVCPTTATRQRPDGIVTIDYDMCIGCAYCDVACPYQARFKIDAPRFAYGNAATQNETEREEPHRLGVAQKCTFCSDRIDFGIANGLTPGLDSRATPACVNACIADALIFGDLDNPDSNVSRLLREQQSFRMHDELQTMPGFHYVYGQDSTTAPPARQGAAAVAEPGQIRSRGIEPSHQQHWDWKAGANFVCGGAGAGLFIIATAASPRSGPPFAVGLAAMGIVALGLFLLLFKIGRPLRSLYVFRQPQRSWMSREAWIAGAFFVLAAPAIWFGLPVLAIAAAVSALLFLFSQAMILKEAKGVPAWRIAAIVPLVVTTGFAEGAGLFLLAAALMPQLGWVAEPTAILVVTLVAARGWMWWRYRVTLTDAGAPIPSLTALNRYRPFFSVAGFLLPVAFILVGIVATQTASIVFPLGALCAVVAGSGLKFVLVTRAGYNQGFALEHTPVRGTGTPGHGVKPGWSQPLSHRVRLENSGTRP